MPTRAAAAQMWTGVRSAGATGAWSRVPRSNGVRADVDAVGTGHEAADVREPAHHRDAAAEDAGRGGEFGVGDAGPLGLPDRHDRAENLGEPLGLGECVLVAPVQRELVGDRGERAAHREVEQPGQLAGALQMQAGGAGAVREDLGGRLDHLLERAWSVGLEDVVSPAFVLGPVVYVGERDRDRGQRAAHAERAVLDGLVTMGPLGAEQPRCHLTPSDREAGPSELRRYADGRAVGQSSAYSV